MSKGRIGVRGNVKVTVRAIERCRGSEGEVRVYEWVERSIGGEGDCLK